MDFALERGEPDCPSAVAIAGRDGGEGGAKILRQIARGDDRQRRREGLLGVEAAQAVLRQHQVADEDQQQQRRVAHDADEGDGATAQQRRTRLRRVGHAQPKAEPDGDRGGRHLHGDREADDQRLAVVEDDAPVELVGAQRRITR